MGKQCSAVGCTNCDNKPESKERNISFHKFPIKNPNLCNEWAANMKRKNVAINEHIVVCSEHFEEDCFTYQPFTHRRFLKTGAVPTKFNLPETSKRKSFDEPILKDKTFDPAKQFLPVTMITDNEKSSVHAMLTKDNSGPPQTDARGTVPVVAQQTQTQPFRSLSQAASAPSQQTQNQSKYSSLLTLIEDMGRDIRPTYAGNRGSSERLKRSIVHARILVRDCLTECERIART
ncbi:THAP domain-containing protein 3-like [Physella acuta]|uniref:THAP domain-containing protein 3-like n=1 Tax=Physella acuta TaxID=109671 RepID=UPI0027DD4678|nr:THAP domain-containing protein 3-like [Physella acuta]